MGNVSGIFFISKEKEMINNKAESAPPLPQVVSHVQNKPKIKSLQRGLYQGTKTVKILLVARYLS